MTDLRTSTPPATETLAALIERSKREFDAIDGDNEVNAVIRKWEKTRPDSPLSGGDER
jgi:hypothetical protein